MSTDVGVQVSSLAPEKGNPVTIEVAGFFLYYQGLITFSVFISRSLTEIFFRVKHPLVSTKMLTKMLIQHAKVKRLRRVKIGPASS